MRPAFGEPALVEDEDAVGIGDRRQAVRDGERRAVFRYAAQRLQDFLFGTAVERARRLVQQQDQEVSIFALSDFQDSNKIPMMRGSRTNALTGNASVNV